MTPLRRVSQFSPKEPGSCLLESHYRRHLLRPHQAIQVPGLGDSRAKEETKPETKGAVVVLLSGDKCGPLPGHSLGLPQWLRGGEFGRGSARKRDFRRCRAGSRR